MPQRQRKKMMALTTNVMRDDSDKVKFININACDGIFLSVILGIISSLSFYSYNLLCKFENLI